MAFRYYGTVKRIIDGDTVEMYLDLGFKIGFTHNFRLYGFDAPETYRPKDEAEKQAGLAAKAFLEKLLAAQPQPLIVESYKREGVTTLDRYVLDVSVFCDENGVLLKGGDPVPLASVMTARGFTK